MSTPRCPYPFYDSPTYEELPARYLPDHSSAEMYSPRVASDYNDLLPPALPPSLTFPKPAIAATPEHSSSAATNARPKRIFGPRPRDGTNSNFSGSGLTKDQIGYMIQDMMSKHRKLPPSHLRDLRDAGSDYDPTCLEAERINSKFWTHKCCRCCRKEGSCLQIKLCEAKAVASQTIQDELDGLGPSTKIPKVSPRAASPMPGKLRADVLKKMELWRSEKMEAVKRAVQALKAGECTCMKGENVVEFREKCEVCKAKGKREVEQEWVDVAVAIDEGVWAME